MAREWNLRRWARWGWLATTVAMGMAVVATAWSGYVTARDASSVIYRGQADLLRSAIFRTVRERQGRATSADLDSILRAQWSEGLRYVATSGVPGVIDAQAGAPATGPERRVRERDARDGGRFMVLTEVGARIRARLEPRLATTRGPRAGRDAPGSDSSRAAAAESLAIRFRPMGITFEFEPVTARELASQGARSVALSAAVAGLLMLASILFWRMSQAQEEIERRLEHQRRLGVLGEMSAVLAHELRNPLASLKGHAQLLAERLTPETSEGKKAERIVREATRLESLTSNLLEFARSAPVNPAPTDPAALLRAAAAEVDGDRFALDVAEAPPSWRLDAAPMRGALTNVLRNAMQASPEGSPVAVRLAEEAGRLAVTVRDRGAGIPPGQEEKIFEPFVTTRAAGTGLGLAVARRVVAMHGGTITAANDPRGGAVFRIEIPPA